MLNRLPKFFYACVIATCVAAGLLAGCSGSPPNPGLRRLKELSAHERDSLMKTLLTSYKDTFKVDSVDIVAKGDTASVRVRHYCTYDGKIDLPAQYMSFYGLESFQTHNFVSEVEFKINSKVVFKGVISKETFGRSLNERQKKYGVLSRPEVDLIGKQLSIEYGVGGSLNRLY
jgi:hypothetical protein